jgi:preprotein translocase SecE subunit
VSGESRRQRRDARRALGDEQKKVEVPAAVDPMPVPRPATAGDARVVALPDLGTGKRRRFAFVQESIAELRKVEWPKRPQVVQGTIVVIIACAVVGLYLYVADLGFKPFVRDVLLNR